MLFLIKNFFRIFRNYKLSSFLLIFFEIFYFFRGFKGFKFNFSINDHMTDNIPCPYYFLFKPAWTTYFETRAHGCWCRVLSRNRRSWFFWWTTELDFSTFQITRNIKTAPLSVILLSEFTTYSDILNTQKYLDFLR